MGLYGGGFGVFCGLGFKCGFWFAGLWLNCVYLLCVFCVLVLYLGFGVLSILMIALASWCLSWNKAEFRWNLAFRADFLYLGVLVDLGFCRFGLVSCLFVFGF